MQMSVRFLILVGKSVTGLRLSSLNNICMFFFKSIVTTTSYALSSSVKLKIWSSLYSVVCYLFKTYISQSKLKFKRPCSLCNNSVTHFFLELRKWTLLNKLRFLQFINHISLSRYIKKNVFFFASNDHSLTMRLDNKLHCLKTVIV